MLGKYAIDDATKPIELWEISRQLLVEKGYEKVFMTLNYLCEYLDLYGMGRRSIRQGTTRGSG